MIEIILFVMACFAWQAIKNAVRGPKIPTVSLRKEKITKAKCGCTLVDDGVIKPCEAHELLLKIQ